MSDPQSLKCPLCASSESSLFYGFGSAPDGQKLVVNNRICHQCNLVYLADYPDPSCLKNYYSGYMAKTQPDVAHVSPGFEEQVTAIARLRCQQFKSCFNNGDKVLDVGCGFGAFLKVLRDESGLDLELMGLNPEAALAEYGKNQYGLDIRAQMLEEADFSDSCFDVVVLDNVIEHFASPCLAMQKIHQILKPGGRVLIVTNDVTQLHGAPWCNFFPDHTVTFSPHTLTVLLKSEGFDVTALTTEGHVTHAGYHYPYQVCVAQKSARPLHFVFSSTSTTWQEQIKNMFKYEKNYLATLPSKSHNHTLPPEDFFTRHLLVAECVSDADVGLVKSLIKASGQSFCYFILRPREKGLYLEQYPWSYFKSEPQRDFTDRRAFWVWLRQNSKTVHDAVAMRLDHADLKEDVLKRLYDFFKGRGVQYIVASYRQFTSARIEFLTAEIFTAIENKNDNLEQDLVATQGRDLKYELAFPEQEDFEYYYKTRFDEYYSTPICLSLDLNPLCDKSCHKCQFHSPVSPYREFIQQGKIMPKELAFRLLDEASLWEKKPIVSATFSGEPLLYPYIHEVYTYARQKGFEISFFTNGINLTEEMSRFLIDVGVHQFSVSLDATHEDLYAQLQAPGNLDLLHNNIIKFLELRGDRKKPKIGLHMVYGLENKNIFDDFLNFWSGKVDSISRGHEQDQFLASQPKLPRWIPLGKRKACWAAWEVLYVRWNGNVSLCGFDIKADVLKMNVKNHSMLDIWNSEPYWQWREAQLGNDQQKLYCRACPDWCGKQNVKVRTDKWNVVRSAIGETYYPAG